MVNCFKTLACVETLMIPFLIYALTKLILPIPENSSNTTKLLRCLLRIFLTVITIPILITTIFIFGIFFEFAKFICKLYFGNDFYDGLSGADAMWNYNTSESKSIIHVLFLVENKPGSPELMMNLCKNPIFQDTIIKNHPQLTCLKEYFLGYYYFIKTKINYNKIINYMEEYDTLEEFKDVINRITSKNLPYDDKLMWEILIGKKAIQLETGKLQYPVVMRFHHSMTDGISLAMFIMANYAENGVNLVEHECERLNKVFSKPKKPKKKTIMSPMKIWNQIKMILSKDIYYHHDMLNHTEHSNILHEELSGNKVVCFSFEQNNEDLMIKVKMVKRKLKVSFADVILGAISAALSEYFVKHVKVLPDMVLSTTPYFLKTGELDKMVKINSERETVTNLGNKISMSFIELPIDKDLLKNPIGFIYKLNKTTQDIKSSMDFELNYWLFNIISTIVPKEFAVPLKQFFDSTAVITNVPGVIQHNFKNKCKIENIIVWTINYLKIGMALTLFTYANQFRITLNIDQSLVRNLSDTQKIGDDIFKYINIFYEQTFKTTK